MILFNEIYGAYFRIAERVLARKSVTEQDIRNIIGQEGFRDSVLFVPQKLIPQADGSDWGLLKRNPDGKFAPVIQHPPVKLLTVLQKRWLKAKLADPRMALFLPEDVFAALSEALADVKPLYQPAWFRCADRFADGDPYMDAAYRSIFRTVLDALQTQSALDMDYTTSRGNRIHRLFVPLRLEYSGKNDKFRLYGYGMTRSGNLKDAIINLGRITAVKKTAVPEIEIPSLEQCFAARKCREPVTVRVTQERNGTERFLMEFASYEKRTDLDTKTGTLTVQLWYDKQDETELLIQLLSFGPVLEILSPPEFRAQAAVRIAKQYSMLHAPQESSE